MPLPDILDIPCLLSSSQKLAMAHLAAGLPAGATIVEVGPYRGGSTRLLHDSAPGCQVHTIDLYDNIDRTLIGNTGRIHITIGGVEAFAREYSGPGIDLLFIDGDHSFFGAKHDFTTLRRFLKPGAAVAFHDYNLPYLGVRLLCDALLALGVLDSAADVDGMLAARYLGDEAHPAPGDYAAALDRVLAGPLPRPEPPEAATDTRKYRALIAALSEQWTFIGKGAMGRFFAAYFGLDFGWFKNSSDIRGDTPCIVCSHLFKDIARQLATAGVRPEHAVDGRSVLSYGFFEDLLLREGERLRTLSPDADEQAVVGLLAQAPENFLILLYQQGWLLNLFLKTTL